MLRHYCILGQSKPLVGLHNFIRGYYSNNNCCKLARPWLLRCRLKIFEANGGVTLLHPTRTCAVIRPRQNGGLGYLRPFSNTNKVTDNEHQTTKLQSWTFKLNNSFGKVISNTCFPMRVIPLSPVKFPSADHIFVHLLLQSPVSSYNLSDFISYTFKEACTTNVDLSPDQVLKIDGSFRDDKQAAEFANKLFVLSWNVEIPMSFDLQLKSTGIGQIYTEKMENKTCSFETEKGDCVMDSLKTGQAMVSTKGGSIISLKSLLGNTELTTNEGKIKTDKLQGHVMKLTSNKGAIHCGDVYGKSTTIQTNDGNITAGNLHGECNIKSKTGNINIGSLDGSLHSELVSGTLDVYAIAHKDIYINNTQGDVLVKVPNEVNTNLDLQAHEITLPDTTEFSDCDHQQLCQMSKVQGRVGNPTNDGNIEVKAPCGKITIKTLSWFDSLSFLKT